VTITSAHLVDSDIVFNDVIVDATPIKGSILRYTLIAIVSLLLLMAIIIPSVILTRKSTSNPTNKIISSPAANELLKELKPLLTNTSRQELERRDSSQSLAFDWLSNNSNFSAYSFDCKLQRFAMANSFSPQRENYGGKIEVG
jgi:hypothetical protein